MDKSRNISRRDFLKYMGAGAASLAAASCGIKDKDNKSESIAGTGKMEMRTNHNTGDTVSLLGYGMMRLPTKKVMVGDHETQVIDQEMVNQLIDVAMANGVNYYDTSPAYMMGKSEESTGIALSRYPRDSYYIATKLSNFAPQTQSHEASVEMFENSLKYLQTDYVDYLLLHAIGGGMDDFNRRFIDNGILDYLVEQKEKGRIRNLGWSFHGDVEVFDTMLQWMDEGKYHWDFVQIQMNYIDWYGHKQEWEKNIDAEYLYNELTRRNIPVVIMEPILGGSLAKVPQPLLAKMKQRRPDDSAAAWAFRFCGTYPNVLTSLSGMTYMEHLEDNLRTHSPLEPLDDDELEFLRLATKEYMANNLIPCTECKYCMPCPYGVDIPAVFKHYNKCITEGNVSRDKADPNYAKARRAFLMGYDRQVPVMRQASRCIDCGECLSHCPQKIKIPQQMRQIDDYAQRLRIGEA